MKIRFGWSILLLIGLFAGLEGISQTAQQEQLKQIKSTVIEKINGQDFYIHTIKRGQTLYMISKAYGVNVNDIIAENPFVKEGIKTDQKLKIAVPGSKPPPAKKPKPKEKPEVVKDTKVDNITSVSKSDSVVVVDLPCGQDMSTKKEEYRVALMLPLYLDDVDHINAEYPEPMTIEHNRSFLFLPYYEGFLIALDSVIKSGARIRLYVYDADKDTAKTQQILGKPEMKSMDLIFGILYQQNFRIVATFAKKNKINLVNAISERSAVVKGNPYLFKVQPSLLEQSDQLARYMSTAFSDGQILIVRNGKYQDKSAADRLKKACQERNISARIVEGLGGAISSLSNEKKNYIIAFSEDQTYALEFMREMYKLRNEYNLTLVGLPNWSSMKNLENEYLVGLNVHMAAQSFIDYDNPRVKTFVGQYQGRFKTDPDTLAFQGFDQAFYFLSALNKFGTNIGRCLSELKSEPLQTRFDFTHSGENGFENRYWTIFKYDNYKLVPVN